MIDVLDIFADDKQVVLLRPRWNTYTGGFLSSVVLQQIFYHWNNRGRRPFFKFLQPCEHQKYRKGDSWEEELNISRKEFSTALKTIAFKRTEKTRKHQTAESHQFPVEYWTDGDRVTHYTIHEENFRALLANIYAKKSDEQTADIEEKDDLNPQTGFRSEDTKIPKRDLPLNPQTGFSKIPKRDFALHYTESKIKEYTKTTTTPTPPTDSKKTEQRSGCGGSLSSKTQQAQAITPNAENHRSDGKLDEPLTVSLLAQVLDTSEQAVTDLIAFRQTTLNEVCHAVAYAVKHRGTNKGQIAKPLLWLRNGKDAFDSKGGFLHHNGTRHIDIPALQAWFYRLTPAEQKRIVHPDSSNAPSYMALKKAERWLNPDFQRVVFAAAQSYGNEKSASGLSGKTPAA